LVVAVGLQAAVQEKEEATEDRSYYVARDVLPYCMAVAATNPKLSRWNIVYIE
jgi:hypothetical protein